MKYKSVKLVILMTLFVMGVLNATAQSIVGDWYLEIQKSYQGREELHLIFNSNGNCEAKITVQTSNGKVGTKSYASIPGQYTIVDNHIRAKFDKTRYTYSPSKVTFYIDLSESKKAEYRKLFVQPMDADFKQQFKTALFKLAGANGLEGELEFYSNGISIDNQFYAIEKRGDNLARQTGKGIDPKNVVKDTRESRRAIIKDNISFSISDGGNGSAEKGNTKNPYVSSPRKVSSSDDAGQINYNKIYEKAEEMPCFPGGETALSQYITSHKKYPRYAEENGIQGRVTVQFIVQKDGSLSDIKVQKSVDPRLDAEAMRVVQSMPRWIPGKINGNPVAVKYSVPVIFRLI